MSGTAKYEVRIKASAEKELDALPANVAARVVRAMLSLERDPRRPGCKKLKGYGGYRCRVGNYRILYFIDDAARVVEIAAVAHRKDAYR